MHQVFYELKVSGKLPSPAGVGMKILQLTQREDCSLDEITDVVRTDPSLTGRILKVANTFTGSGAASAAPLEEAVLTLGMTSLRDLVLGFSLISNNPRVVCRAFDYGAFWHRSLGRAVAAQQLSLMSGSGSAAESYVCGLLCSVGRLGLASAHPERYSAILEGADGKGSETLLVAESRAFGIQHRELTEALLVDWGFPKRLARAAAGFEAGDDGGGGEKGHSQSLRRVLSLADQLAGVIDPAGEGFKGTLPEDLMRALESLEIHGETVKTACGTIRRVWQEWGALLNVAGPRRGSPRAAPVSERGGAGSADREQRQGDGEIKPTENGSSPTVVSLGDGMERIQPGPLLLLLERDDRQASRMEPWLGSVSYQVTRARTVREALQVAVAKSPQLVVARGEVGDPDALDLCKALRRFEAGRTAFFLLATSDRNPRRLLAAFDAGIDDYLLLPCESSEGLLRLQAAQRVVQLRARLVDQEKTLQQNLAELAVANRRLYRAAMTDELTQLANRRFGEETMKEEWTVASLRDLDLALVLGDVDRFKAINDTYGHLVGDLVLSTLAKVIRNEIRASDVACRFGGEEFLVVCPGTDLAGARALAERLRERIASTEIAVSGTTIRATISLGVASRRMGVMPAKGVEEVLKAADEAAYASKAGGRNRVSAAGMGSEAVAVAMAGATA